MKAARAVIHDQDIPIILVLNQGFIFLELTKNFMFAFQEIYPGCT